MYQVLGQRKSKDNRRIEIKLHNNLSLVEECFQNYPMYIEAKKVLAQASNSLTKLQNVKTQGSKTNARLYWFIHGNIGSRYFFHIFNCNEVKYRIVSIWEDARELKNQEDIL